ncbi:hypothetical protein Shyhy01_17790 [Streptomyces hygroscopicus subsp. hygroscopicus]|nr:hypothetical protein Shyhy01_17790 [Streptomyces hygroscopicus subsp. hygroscopicus]
MLCPGAPNAVDAALLAEMAVPHRARPAWPDIPRLDHDRALPHQPQHRHHSSAGDEPYRWTVGMCDEPEPGGG